MENRRTVTTFISLGDIRAAGIRSISALLTQKGWPTNIVIYKLGYSLADIPTRAEEDILLDLLKTLKTDIVCLSVKTPFFKTAQSISARVKNEMDALVVWGGSHPTIMPEECARIADVACRGEGEFPILELVENVHGGKPYSHTENLCIASHDSTIMNDTRPPLCREDLNALPFPDCGGDGKYIINNGRLIPADPLSTAIEYYPSASRGCPFQCSFCINGILHEQNPAGVPAVRVRDPKNVVDEIVHAIEKFPSLKRIRFQDEVFPWKKQWVETFCQEYKQRVGLPFLCTFHPNIINEEIVATLKRAGLVVVGFGMQSPTERVRKEVFNRPESNQTILHSIDILHRHKIDGYYDIIFDNPFETEDDKQAGLDFLLRIPKPFNIAPFALRFFPGYAITEAALSRQLISQTEVRAIQTQGYFEMTHNLYAPRKREDLFWNCLYLLSSRSVIPRQLVRGFSRWGFARRRPQLLVLVLRISWYPELLVIGIRRIVRGQISPVNVFRILKSKILNQTI